MSDNIELIDKKALFNIGYGLYVITTHDGNRDNGFICNTVVQLTSDPLRILVSVNKNNYSYESIMKSGIMCVNVLNIDAPFKVFEQFGFQSGKNVDKFANEEVIRSSNYLRVMPQYINSYFSLKVDETIDMTTHGVFICSVLDAKTINQVETMTYTYYQNNVKPKPQTTKKKGFVCKICGYIYEGDALPQDFICPLCKHPASDFEPLQ